MPQISERQIMTTEVNWTIAAIDCATVEGDKTNVVKTVHWRCDGVDGDYTGSICAACKLPAPEGDFIAYADLTKDQVLSWVWANGVDKDNAESVVRAQIDAAKNPPIVQPALPWASSAE